MFGIRGALLIVGLMAPLGVLIALPKLRRLDGQMQTADAGLELLQRVEMLKPLPLATISARPAGATTDILGPGGVVIEERTIGDDFYVISEGRAEVLVDGARVRELQSSDCFGEIAALTGSHRTAPVRALSSLSVLRFSGRQFVRAVTGSSPSSAAATTRMNDRLARGVSTTAQNRPATSTHLT